MSSSVKAKANLCCYVVDGHTDGPTSASFCVEVDENSTIEDLKKAILKNVDLQVKSAGLKLWKASTVNRMPPTVKFGGNQQSWFLRETVNPSNQAHQLLDYLMANEEQNYLLPSAALKDYFSSREWMMRRVIHILVHPQTDDCESPLWSGSQAL